MAKVSIIIACLNGIKTVGKAIETAQFQTEKDLEILIVDDGSSDGTADYCEAYARKDPRVKIIRLEKNVGAPAATNIAIEQAAGEWIAILDADDWFEPRRIEVLMKAATESGADLVMDNLKIFDHALGEVIEETHHTSPGRVLDLTAEYYFNHDNPLRRYAIGYTKPVVKKKFLMDNKIAYRPDHRFGYDFIFLTEILLCGARAVIVPGAYYVYVHRISPTTRKQSPHSRSESGHTLILRGCNELLAKYDATMTPDQRAALTRRRDIFKSRLRCQDMLNAIYDRHYVPAIGILLGRPFILVLIGTTIAKQLYANMLTVLRSLRRRLGMPAYTPQAN